MLKNQGRRKESGGRKVEDLGKKWLRSQLLQLSRDIYQLEQDIVDKKPGARAHNLKDLVITYNQALIEIFGEADAKKLPNLKCTNDFGVSSFIPNVEQLTVEKKPVTGSKEAQGKVKRSVKTPVKRLAKREAKNRGDELIIFFDDADIGFDSEEVIYKLIGEQAQHSEKGKLQFFFNDQVSLGVACVVVLDPVSEDSYIMGCKLNQVVKGIWRDNLEVIRLAINLFLENGYSVNVVVNPADANKGFVAPPNHLSSLN